LSSLILLVVDLFTLLSRIDTHNQARQYHLALEKKWVTQDCWFRVFTTLLGMTVTDAWRALKYSVPQKSPYKTITIRDFSDLLAGDILEMAETKLDRRRSGDRAVVLPSIVGEANESARSIMTAGRMPVAESVSEVTTDSAVKEPRLLLVNSITATTTAERCNRRRKRERCLECASNGRRSLTSYYFDLCVHQTSVGGKYYRCGIHQRNCFEMHTCKKHRSEGVNV
jgi:hypothetical protein